MCGSFTSKLFKGRAWLRRLKHVKFDVPIDQPALNRFCLESGIIYVLAASVKRPLVLIVNFNDASLQNTNFLDRDVTNLYFVVLICLGEVESRHYLINIFTKELLKRFFQTQLVERKSDACHVLTFSAPT